MSSGANAASDAKWRVGAGGIDIQDLYDRLYPLKLLPLIIYVFAAFCSNCIKYLKEAFKSTSNWNVNDAKTPPTNLGHSFASVSQAERSLTPPHDCTISPNKPYFADALTYLRSNAFIMPSRRWFSS